MPVLATLALLWIGWLSFDIVSTGSQHARGKAKVAIVLGAAIDGDSPSPVFAERIRHGVRLYKSRRVERLIFTGGTGEGEDHSEASVGMAWALAQGVPRSAILIEERSHTTFQNLVQAKAVLGAASKNRVFIVTDPLHSARALRMARSLRLDADGAPTPTSRYRSFEKRIVFLARELWFHHVWWIKGG